MKIIHLFRLTQRQIQIRSYRQQSPQEVQARVRVLVTHRVHLGGEQVGITARLQDINNLDTAVQCNHKVVIRLRLFLNTLSSAWTM